MAKPKCDFVDCSHKAQVKVLVKGEKSKNLCLAHLSHTIEVLNEFPSFKITGVDIL